MSWFHRKQLRIGQIWTMKNSDPFSKSEFEEEIIDIKDGYILVQARIASWLREKWKNSGDMEHFPDPIERSYKESDFRFFYSILVKDVE